MHRSLKSMKIIQKRKNSNANLKHNVPRRVLRGEYVCNINNNNNRRTFGPWRVRFSYHLLFHVYLGIACARS